MWKHLCITVLTLGTAACAGPREYSAPAPAGALDCALREALELGYQRVTGEPRDLYLRVAQRIEPPRSQPLQADPLPGADRVLPVSPDQPVENQLAFLMREGRLRVQVLSVTEGGEPVPPGHDAEAHAQIVLAACTAEPTAAREG